jgi:acylglycerol lipase
MLPGMAAAMRNAQETWEDGLFAQRWEPEGAPRAVVYLLHGLGEHSGRYGVLAERFTAAGIAVSTLDWRGHGRSRGPRGDTRFKPALGDLEQLLARGAERWPGVPAFLYGHSLGALLAVAFLAGERVPPLAGAVISAVGFHSALREQRAKVRLARVFGRVAPRMRLLSGIDPDTLSHDPKVVAAYRADPLVHDRVSTGFGLDALETIDRILAGRPNPAVPLLLIHGSDDQLAYVSGAREFAAAAGPERCTLRVYEGLSHEVHNEPDQERVFADVLRWMDATLSSAPPT